MTPTIEVALGLVQENDRWLVSRRAPGRVFAGLWEFPGGKMQDGETAITAAVREVQEETGLSVEPVEELGTLVTSQPEHSVRLHLVLCRPVSGQAAPCDCSILEVRWVTYQELCILPMPPANAEILSCIGPHS